MDNSLSHNEFEFIVAEEKDNQEIIHHTKSIPISMEVDYIMDRKDDFFRIHKLNKGSLVFIARSRKNHEIVACVSLLKMKAKVGNEIIEFQYVTDLIKDSSKASALTMQQLLNYALENYFDAKFLFGLINEKNIKARMFSSSKHLSVNTKIATRFNYIELIPIVKHRLGNSLKFKPPTNTDEISEAIKFINDHYKNHQLFYPLDENQLSEMIRILPDFSFDNVIMMYQNNNLQGVMIYYDPQKLVSLVVERMDTQTKILVKCVRLINNISGLLFSPPYQGDYIKTIQVRYLAGNRQAQSKLLSFANNIAKTKKYHSVSLLVDEKEDIKKPNKIVFVYKSLMYLGYKKEFALQAPLLKTGKVFIDITYT